MTNLNGKELMRGDPCMAMVEGEVVVGRVHEFYDRTQEVRLQGFPLPIKASKTVLAKDAWESHTAKAAPVGDQLPPVAEPPAAPPA